MMSLLPVAIVASTFLATLANGQNWILRADSLGKAQSNRAQSEVRFTFRSGANGTTSKGVPFSMVTYDSDGIVITAMTEKYPNKRRAELALTKKLKTASKTEERTPKLDHNGHRVGTRILATFPHNGDLTSRSVVFWTEGSELHSIGSVSLRHVLEFEKAFK
jgi:hypothetical protein